MKRFFNGFSYAFNGLIYAFKTQMNFKFHVVATLATLGLATYLKISSAEWLWIITAISLVLIAELFNTALEVLVDLVSPAHHPKAGIIKDLSAAAVLLTAFLALFIGLVIFIPKVL
ncbi:MAG: diacylglycerol kinase family protein [Daejeonella sp.]